MRITQRADHAVRALTYLAQHRWGEPIPAGDIARALGLPQRFLEQQMSLLGKKGIVECRRGAGGGCLLALDAEDVTVREIVAALDGDVLDIPRIADSAVSDLWAELREAVAKKLDSLTLADVAAMQDRKDATASEMYYI
jgi:Rrf2 family protein